MRAKQSHGNPRLLCRYTQGTWAKFAEQWYNNTSPEDLHHVACLRIPRSFYSPLPPGYGPHFRECVARHQYMMLHIVYQLRKEFTWYHIGPPHAATSGMSFPYNVATYPPSYTTYRHSAENTLPPIVVHVLCLRH